MSRAARFRHTLQLAPLFGLAFLIPLTAQTAAPEKVGRDACLTCHDLKPAFLHTPHNQVECEDCHGPGSLHIEEPDDTFGLDNLPAREASQRCLSCHKAVVPVSTFVTAPHGRGDISCISCHSIHPDRVSFDLLKTEPTDLCISCHKMQQAQFRRPYHHPVLEGGMSCVNCHDPHSEMPRRHQRVSVGVEQACVSCHVEKKGPFVFEHAPLKVDGCGDCHQPHGSVNPYMLTRSQVAQLCLDCHSMTPGVESPQPPSFHDIRSRTFQNCTICHRSIHGSNVNPAFLR